jgi:nucleotide-binding universal stress UspA family protein
MKTPSIRNILVPIDFSLLSIQAIETAKCLALRFNATIHLAHVHEFYSPVEFAPPMPPVIPYPTYTHDQEAGEKAARDLTLLAKRHELPPSTAHLLIGAPAFDTICRLARELPADLIVTPTHGWTGLKHVFFGSTAERVVQHSPCPVFVARERTKSPARNINKILVPVDYSTCSLAGLQYAIEFAKKVAARLIVLHVVDLGPQLMTDGYGVYDRSPYKEAAARASERQMRAFLRLVNFGSVPFETSAAAEFCPEGIYRVAKKDQVDLIIMSTHGRTGLKHILMGSVAERVVRRAPCPVLVVPSHPEMRSAHLAPLTPRARRTKLRKIPLARYPRETFTRKCRKLAVNPLPERRKTNKFREAHLSQ